MRFFALLSLLPLLQVASATFGHHNPAPPVYCGTTTITKTACATSITKAPAVTKTFTKDKAVCFTTEVKTAVATVTNKVKVTETVTNTPTEYKTKWAPALTATKTKQVVKKTCAPQRFKRSFTAEELAAEEVDEDDVAEDEEDVDFISNAERLRRGLPLNKPNEKRTFGHGHPQPPRPSCVPSTSVEWVKTTSIKTVTPTQWATTTKCRYTHTIDKIQHTTATVLKTKTITATVVGKPTTVKTTLTPTSTITTTSTSTKITGVCHPTAV